MSLSERAGVRPMDGSRDLQEVTLSLIDGTEVRGMLHRAHGTRTLDYLNRQAEGFVAMTQCVVSVGGHTEQVPFVAINKAHIVRVVESAIED